MQHSTLAPARALLGSKDFTISFVHLTRLVYAVGVTHSCPDIRLNASTSTTNSLRHTHRDTSKTGFTWITHPLA